MAAESQQYNVHHGEREEDEDDDDVFTADPTRECQPMQVSSPFSSTSRPSEGPRQTLPITTSIWTLISLVTFLADVFSDVYVSGHYFVGKHYWWFGFALGFVVTASLAMQVFSAKWFYDDGTRQSVVNYLLHVFQMGPVIRYWTAIKLCWQSRRKGGIPQARELFTAEWRDLSMLRLLQAFLQSAPQLVLQLYVIARRGRFTLNEDLSTAVSAGTSLVSIIWSILCYSKALRDMRPDPGSLPCLGFLFQMLWRTSMITSRVLALVLFASYFTHWMFVAAAVHWLLMAMWLSCQRTQFCIDETGREHPCREKLFNAVIAFIYIFCFFNTKEGMTRKRVVLFYSVMLVENSLLISMWYPHRTVSPMLTYVALIVVWGGFVLGVIFMVLYYRFYHHSRRYKGIFLRKRQFDYDDRVMYGLYCCCCCRVRKWEVEDEELVEFSDGPRLLLNRPLDGAQEVDIDDLPTPPPEEGNNQGWNMKTGNVTRSNGFSIQVHNGEISSPRELSPNVGTSGDVPDIMVTSATPTRALSPHESPRNSEIRSKIPENPASEDPCHGAKTVQNENDIEHELADNREEFNYDEEHVHRQNHVSDITSQEDPTSPSLSFSSAENAKRIVAEKLGKRSDDSHDEGTTSDHDDLPRINYGSLSFSNRYSLVSSDCISLSSASSVSSFNSVNDILDHMDGSSSSPKVDVKSKTPNADEGIFSDDRDDKSTPEKVPLVVARDLQTGTWQQKGGLEEEVCAAPILERNGTEMIELIMDVPPSPWQLRKTTQPITKDESSEKGERSESESTESSSEGNYSGHERRSLGALYSQDASTSEEETNKRHSIDFAELSRSSRKFRKKEKERKRRKHKLITFDNFVPSPLKAGRFGSLRNSFERLSKIQEDGEECPQHTDDKLVFIPLPVPIEEQEKLPRDKVDLSEKAALSPWLKHNTQIYPASAVLLQRALLAKSKSQERASKNSKKTPPKDSLKSCNGIEDEPTPRLAEGPTEVNTKPLVINTIDNQNDSISKKVLSVEKDSSENEVPKKPSESPDRNLVEPVTSNDIPVATVREQQREEGSQDQENTPPEIGTCEKQSFGELTTNDIARESSKRSRPVDLPPEQGSPKRQRVKEFLLDELIPSKCSSVRRSREKVPLACSEDLEDFSDMDDLGDDTEEEVSEIIIAQPVSQEDEDTADTSIPSLFETDIPPDYRESSGSSIFENPLFASSENRNSLGLDSLDRKNEKKLVKRRLGFEEFGPVVYPDDIHDFQYAKRHTFDFASSVTKENGIRTLNVSNSLPVTSNANPIWVHNIGAISHRRRRPTSDMAVELPLAEGVITEVRV